MSRSIRSIFGAVLLLLVFNISSAFGQEKDADTTQKGKTVSGASEDLHDVQFGLWTSFYGSKVTHRGGETNSRYGNSSTTIYGRGTLTDGDILFQAGLYGTGEFDRFEGLDGGEYEGDSTLFGGGLDTVIALRNSDYWYNPPTFVFSGRIGLLYKQNEGELKDASYQAETEELLLQFRAEIQAPWALEYFGACHAWRIKDGDDVIIGRKGAISNIVLSFGGKISLDSNRRTTVTRNGGKDDQDGTEFEWGLKVELFKLASDTTDLSKKSLIEFGFAVSYGEQYMNAYGSNTRDDGKQFHISKFAVHALFSVDRTLYVEGVLGGWLNPNSHADSKVSSAENDQSGVFASLSVGFSWGASTNSEDDDSSSSKESQGP